MNRLFFSVQVDTSMSTVSSSHRHIRREAKPAIPVVAPSVL